MIVWPFGTDADEHDPLTALRIPVVSSPNPSWCYVAAFLAVNTDRYGWGSAERPTDAEAAMLVSFLAEHRHYWFGNAGYALKMDTRPLDLDSGWNTTVFIKYGPDDWGYRRVSWVYGPLFVPGPPGSDSRAVTGPLSLERVMDRTHTIGDEPMAHWVKWKADHPEVFPAPPKES